MLDIVVAHYNEDITWIKKIKSNKINKIFVYSKGEPNKINDKKIKQLNPKIIHNYRPNIGRESETYLRFCYENYNNLSDGDEFNDIIIDQMVMDKASEVTPSYLDHYDVADKAREMIDYVDVIHQHVSP